LPDCCGFLGCASPGKGKKCPSKKRERKETDREKRRQAVPSRSETKCAARPKKLPELFVSKRRNYYLMKNGAGEGELRRTGRGEAGAAAFPSASGSGGLCNCKASAMPWVWFVCVCMWLTE